MMNIRFATGIVLILLLGGLECGVYAQRRRPQFPPTPRTEESPVPHPGPSISRRMLRESFEQTQKDVAQLYELAGKLKEETEKADADELSLTVMKKAEEIEKLAEKIKKRMKNL